MPEPAERDLYTVLGVPPTASPAEITSVYRRLVRGLHPDTLATHGPADPVRLAEVMAAYEVLCRPYRRASYDEGRRRPAEGGVTIPVRRIERDRPRPHPDVWLRAGPVRRHHPGTSDVLSCFPAWFFRRWR